MKIHPRIRRVPCRGNNISIYTSLFFLFFWCRNYRGKNADFFNRKAEKFVKILDKIIDAEKYKWPDGADFALFCKDKLPNWKWVEGKYFKIGIAINESVLEGQSSTPI